MVLPKKKVLWFIAISLGRGGERFTALHCTDRVHSGATCCQPGGVMERKGAVIGDGRISDLGGEEVMGVDLNGHNFVWESRPPPRKDQAPRITLLLFHRSLPF